MCTAVTQRANRSVYATNRSWSGWGPFRVFIESDVGYIPTEPCGGMEDARKSLFEPDSIKQVTTELEGARGTASLILDFAVGPEQEIILTPTPGIEGSRLFSTSGEFVVRIRRVRPESLHTVRFYTQHWIFASMFWASLDRPVDQLMTFRTDGQLLVIFPNHHI